MLLLVPVPTSPPSPGQDADGSQLPPFPIVSDSDDGDDADESIAPSHQEAEFGDLGGSRGIDADLDVGDQTDQTDTEQANPPQRYPMRLGCNFRFWLLSQKHSNQ